MFRILPVMTLFIALLLALFAGTRMAQHAQSTAAVPAPDFTRFPAGDARKQAFFDYFLPLIRQANQQILADRERLVALIEQGDANAAEQRWVNQLAERYGVEDAVESPEAWSDLLIRVDGIPPSLALAQAANESAWGTSRFAVDGNNYFGQWCFVEGCGLVPAQRDDGARHEVAVFLSPAQSVQRYMNNINSHFAYDDLRALRAQLRREGRPITGLTLATTLLRYSERGSEYIEELQSMIRFNELQVYDEQSVLMAELAG
ncbi:MAG: glucosaminidase domain-containing protein [Saccharospirillum sp.]